MLEGKQTPAVGASGGKLGDLRILGSALVRADRAVYEWRDLFDGWENGLQTGRGHLFG